MLVPTRDTTWPLGPAAADSGARRITLPVVPSVVAL